MKTSILTLTLALAFIVTGTAQAQSFDNIYKKYKKQEEVTGIKINKLGCMLASLFADSDDEGTQFLKKSSSVRILINESGNKSELTKDLAKYIKKSNLEQLMSIKDDEDIIDIYVLDKKETIHELLIVISDKEEQVIVHLDGKYPLKMIKEMMNEGDGAKKIKVKL